MIAACLKWVDRRPEVDPLSGRVRTDPRSSGASDADLAALEWALRLGVRWGEEVMAVTAGPSAAEGPLREALAVGADRAVRVDVPLDLPSSSVAAALAPVLVGACLVVCGDWSLDRGSGAVPAFLAARLGAAQALGLVGVALPAAPADPVDGLLVERRLDGGRRELLRVRPPAVLSVEGGTARLRRAGLGAVLGAPDADLEVVRPAAPPPPGRPPARTGPHRPRPRVLPAPDPRLPARERVLALTTGLAPRTPPRTVVADPDEAADLLLDQLRAWGERP